MRSSESNMQNTDPRTPINAVMMAQYMQGLQRMAPQKLLDANLESILWNKVSVKLQKEIDQMSESPLQELFQKLLKAEETVNE